MTDDELTESERAALDVWAPLTPPAGFADRVLAARDADVAPRRRWPFVAAGLGAVAAAAIAVVVLRSPSHAAHGELVAPTARTTASLGDRAVAVAEPDAAFAWHIDDDGDAEIDQRAGDVFYRVERGGTFVVHTPVGDVSVTGTCFRIEVPMNRTKQMLLSGTVGAAIAAGVVVTVYEGHVLASTSGGNRAEVIAGSRATMYGDGRGVVASPDGASTTVAALDERTATRDQLLARTQVQQRELAQLRARVAELETPHPNGHRDDAEPGRAWNDPSPERLQQWAAECHIRTDEPGIDRWKAQTDLGKNERGLEPSELPQMNATMTELQQQWKQLVRALYIEATGDMQGADTLATEAMRKEIEERAAEGEHALLLQRIARERAGLALPPPNLAATSPFERLMRAYLTLGEQAEQALAKRLGADRAKAIRGDGWGSHSDWSGCPGEP